MVETNEELRETVRALILEILPQVMEEMMAELGQAEVEGMGQPMSMGAQPMGEEAEVGMAAEDIMRGGRSI